MKDKKEVLRQMKYSDEILDLMAHQDEMTTSDLQGCVDALVNKIIVESYRLLK